MEGKELRNFCFLPCITGMYETELKRPTFFRFIPPRDHYINLCMLIIIGIRKEVIEKNFWPNAQNKWRMETKKKLGAGKPD